MDTGEAHSPLLGGKQGGMGLMTAHSGWANTWNNQQEEEIKERPEEVKLSIELLESLEPDVPGTTGDYSSNVTVVNLPILGRIHILKQKSGFLNLGFIVLYWIYGTWSTCCVILRPHIDDGDASEYIIYFYLIISVLCITSLFRAATTNPGRIPFSREPAASPEHLTTNHCQVCRRRRPQRSHHCRRCGQCILRMDHHCPWINNCVGQENHWAFIQLLWYALLMSVTSLIVCISHIYYWPPCRTCNKESLWEASRPYLGLLSLLMSVLMIAGAGGLLALHLFGLVRDMTTIDWMKLQDEMHRKGRWDPKDMPYVKKTCLKAHDDLCGPGSRVLWPFPCRRRRGPLYLTYPQVV